MSKNENVLISDVGNEPLLGEKVSCCKKHFRTILVFFIILLIIIIGVIVILLLKKDDDDNNDEEEFDGPFKVLKSDKDFIKPKIYNSAEFKLVKTKNGMTVLLINDPFAQISHINFNIPFGSFIDTVDGISHFSEHSIFGGSEKYPDIYSPLNLKGFKKSSINGATSVMCQVYYASVPYNYQFEKVLDIYTDVFRYPLLNENFVKKEIQAVNSEFYMDMKSDGVIFRGVLYQFSSDKTSYHKNTSCGNNQTLKPDESEKLAKKLKGYHMRIKNPKNIFFTLYSNQTINDSEKYIEKYLNYEMHKFSDNEIDLNDKKKLENNILNMEKYDIFDEKLYGHGFYFNSSLKKNSIDIIFNVRNIDYKDLQFDLSQYLFYLFRSESLYQLLIEKNYIAETNYVDVNILDQIENNNNILIFSLILTDEGLNNIQEVLLIFYKYIEIIKKDGAQKKLFENFIKYKKSEQIIKFQKENFNKINEYIRIIVKNYRKYGESQFFTYGTPSIEKYDKNKLNTILNKLQFEKSFFGINVISDPFKLKNIFLDSPSEEWLFYLNKTFLLGKIPNGFKNNITKKELDYPELKIREINNYLSNNFESVIPCYKNNNSNCSELKEFDFENEDEYTPEVIEEDEGFTTFYQIDKSSESNLVKSYLEIKFSSNQEFGNANANTKRLYKYYIENKLRKFNEGNSIKIKTFDQSTLSFLIESFTDNTKLIYEDFILALIEEPSEIEFNYTKSTTKSYIGNSKNTDFFQYVADLGISFAWGMPIPTTNIDDAIKKIEEYEINKFTANYKSIFDTINSIKFKIAGNIDRPLVESIHKYIKGNFTINSEVILKSILKLEKTDNYIINYYQQSEMEGEVDNGIFIDYAVEGKISPYLDLLVNCLNSIFYKELRFELSNSYDPSIMSLGTDLVIFEQGRYKNLLDMENDINTVIYNILNGKIKCDNYSEIIESMNLESSTKPEKTPDYLFNKFVEKKMLSNLKKIEYPKDFDELIKIVSPIFLNPKRSGVLIFRNGISKEEINKTIEMRSDTKYFLNENISVVYTNDFEYKSKNFP